MKTFIWMYTALNSVFKQTVKIKSLLKKRLKSKQNAVDYSFLPAYLEITERPPALWARRSTFVISLLLVTVCLWANVGELEIHASATGRLIVPNHSKIIQPLELGQVIKINVRDGQKVNKGDIIIQLNAIDENAELERLQQQRVKFSLEQSRILALLTADPLANFTPPETATPQQKNVFRTYLASEYEEVKARLDQITSDIQVLTAQLAVNVQEKISFKKLKVNIEERVQAREKLADINAISRVTLLEQQTEVLGIEQQLSSNNAQAFVLNSQILSLKQQQRTITTQKRREYHQSLAEITETLKDIDKELIKAKEKLRVQTLTAPIDGVIQQLAIHTLGGVVSPGEILMVVVPENSLVEAEVMILNKDIGFVAQGQQVEVKIDSFPFTKYGTIKGEVLNISRDAVQDERLGLVFPARIGIKSNHILVDSSMVSLSAGMSVVTEIRTGTRRVIEYILGPLLRYQAEAMRER